MLRSRWTRPTLTVLLPALLALAGACGGGGGGGGGSASSEEKGFRVLETTPFDDELAVERDRVIEITFSDEIDVSTVEPESVKVTQSFTGRVVRGAMIVATDRKSLSLDPDDRLALNTQYRILVTVDVLSRFGERFKKDFVSHFQTVVTEAPTPPPPPPPPTGRLVPVGLMSVGRSSHQATLLADGNVFVTGGWRTSTNTTNAAEIYNTQTQSFNALLVGMRSDRANHTATLLQNGKVLIAGGLTEGGAKVLDSTEIYDPANQTFTVGPRLNGGRAYHTATRLKDGRVLLVAGGTLNASSILVSTRSADIYDPAKNTISALPDLSVYRSDHQATMLESGFVLITGGSYSSKDAELFDPAKDSFAKTNGAMQASRSGHTATRLIGGKVLVYGGGQQSAEIYTPSTRRFDSTIGTPLQDRTSHTADIMATGRVLIVGGYAWNPNLMFHATIEFFNGPPGGKLTFGISPDLLTYPRALHRSTVLKNGDVLITGGANLDPQLPELPIAVLWSFQ